jgi:ring-1,2-phenylacetyl-CoA epoxidase subunit PaaD
MVTRLQADEIRALLSEIPDPEIPVISIQELGILRDVKFDGKNFIVTITPTYTACPAMPLIENQIREKLAGEGIHNVKVITIYSPAWSTDWLSEGAKNKLKEYGIAPPRHSSCLKLSTDSKIHCPRCNSLNTEMISRFGSTACKALYRCNSCKEPFEYFKCH